MMRRYAWLAGCVCAVASFAACGGGGGGDGGTGGSGGRTNGDEPKPGWCQAISVEELSTIVGQEMKFRGSNQNFACGWLLADESASGGVTVVVGPGGKEMVEAMKADALGRGAAVVDVQAGDMAIYNPDDEDEDGAAASLAIAKGPRFLFVTAFHDLSDLGPDTLVQIANLVFDEI